MRISIAMFCGVLPTGLSVEFSSDLFQADSMETISLIYLRTFIDILNYKIYQGNRPLVNHIIMFYVNQWAITFIGSF